MKNYSQHYFIRPLFFLVGLSISLVIIAVVFVNIYLLSSLDDITLKLSEYIGEDIKVGSIYYLPPLSVVFNQVNFLDISRSPHLEYVKQIKVSLSIKKALFKKKIAPKSIRIKDPKIYCYGKNRISEEQVHNVKILLGAFFSQNPLVCSIENANIVTPDKGDVQKSIILNSSIIFNGISFSNKGSVTILKVYSKKDRELTSYSDIFNFSLEGALTGGGFLIEDLTLKKDKVYLKLWGDFLKSRLHLDGYMTVGDFFETYPDYTGLFIKLKSLIFRSKPYIQIVGSSNSSLSIKDINLLVDISYPVVQVKEASFNLNGIPSALYGNMILLDYPSFDFYFRSYPSQAPVNRTDNLKALDVKLTLASTLNGFNGNCNIDFIREKLKDKTKESIDIEFKDLKRYLDRRGNSQIKAEYLDVHYKSDQNYHIQLDNVDIAIDGLKEVKNINFSSNLSGGTLKGEGFLVTESLPLRLNMSFYPDDVDSNDFDFLFFPHVFGKLSGKINYSNYPESELEGYILIENGRTESLDFFIWLSDFFAIPSIKDISFNNVSSSMDISDNSIDFKNMNLDSENIKMEGYFKINSDDLLSSKIKLALSKNVIAESVKFKPLLKILGDELDYLEFDFQLSGPKDAVNFKWLESEFKTRLRDSIPGFIERGLERKVEEAMKSFSLEDQESSLEQ